MVSSASVIQVRRRACSFLLNVGRVSAVAAAAGALGVPCYFNGMGRGLLPADHELAFLRTRGLLKQRADLVVVLGHGDDRQTCVGHALDRGDPVETAGSQVGRGE